MAWSTPKEDWAAGNTPLHTDFNRAEGNTAVLGNLRTYPTATGTGTAIVVTTGYFELTAGRACTFIASADNSAAATTINVDGTGVKNLYKEGGTDAPLLVTGKAYTVWYNGTSFFVKANASGNAIVSDVLATKTFSNDSGTDLTGTMPNNAGDVAAVSSHSGGGGTIHIVPAKGYTDGTDDATVITDADFVAGNIKHNVDVFGITGNYDTEAVAPIAAGTVLDGQKGWVNGAQITGTMPDKSGGGPNNVIVSYTNPLVSIPTGYYDTDTKAALQLVSSGANTVYTGGGSTGSAFYVQLSTATVNYPGTYKVTLDVSVAGFYSFLGVKVNGVVKATTTGVANFDIALNKGDSLTIDGMVDDAAAATLGVVATVSIAEPVNFIA